MSILNVYIIIYNMYIRFCSWWLNANVFCSVSTITVGLADDKGTKKYCIADDFWRVFDVDNEKRAFATM